MASSPGVSTAPFFLHHINLPSRYHYRHRSVRGDDWSALPFPLSTISISTSLLSRLAISSLSWSFCWICHDPCSSLSGHASSRPVSSLIDSCPRRRHFRPLLHLSEVRPRLGVLPISLLPLTMCVFVLGTCRGRMEMRGRRVVGLHRFPGAPPQCLSRALMSRCL